MHGMIKARTGRAAGKSKVSRSRRPSGTATKADAPAMLRVTPRLDRALTKLVEMTGKPKTYHTRRALERYVEDTYDHLVAVESMRRSRKTYSSDEVKRRLGLTGKA